MGIHSLTIPLNVVWIILIIRIFLLWCLPSDLVYFLMWLCIRLILSILQLFTYSRQWTSDLVISQYDFFKHRNSKFFLLVNTHDRCFSGLHFLHWLVFLMFFQNVETRTECCLSRTLSNRNNNASHKCNLNFLMPRLNKEKKQMKCNLIAYFI